ncbi:MATE family efflux transporter [Streptococcus penaeicida]|uniref:MATE family efflux transporter n=1 Tax=Streptococcus penaeicida TaxID=1765960 RepID=A0A2N8LAG1_9STRE|nr:MATE family efflux transporter [Streptococcus penaeicida]PND47146.1 MATE family efflux transporter [Streptococcus penaeicida]
MQNLTKGNPLTVILAFTIPLIIGSFFQLTYNFADSIIVGHTLGQNAFASVGATGSLTFLIIGFAMGLTSGLTIVTSQLYGAEDFEGVKKSFVHGLFYSIVVSLVLSVISLIFLRQLLVLMQTPEHLIQDAYDFLLAIFGGLVFTILFNYLSSAIRSLGNSKTPLVALIIASILNILLEFFFILYLKMGVLGAGIATIIAQAFSVLYLVVYIQKYIPYFHIGRKDLQLDSSHLRNHARLGFPMGFQASIIAIGAITLQITINKLGTDAIAAQAIASKTDQLAMLPMINLGLAISTFTAQNYGAKEYARIRQGLKGSLLICIAWSILFAILLVSCHRFFSGLFIADANPEVFRLALIYYMINGGCYWILANLFILRSFIQGLGYGFVPTLAGIMELVLRAGVAIIGLIYFGFVGIAWASPAAWIGAVIILIPSSLILLKKLNQQEKMEAQLRNL